MVEGFGLGALSFFGLIIFSIIPLIIAYFVIRLAVRHGIESSDVGMIIKRKYEEEKKNNNE